ncbi:MAG TPA: ORF6N domain-containing protein [Chitinophagaceae bacterium]|nr:ORF6N domain-containing protein [Chitinophagaceae bacterium]
MKLMVIQQKIYEIRGQKVMLDFDLAELYGVQTKHLKEAVKRNKKRFPKDFMFHLNKKEFTLLRSQNATSNKRGGTRYMPFAFTEQGVGMLSGILNSGKAVQMHIAIVRAFVTLKQFALNYKDLTEQIQEIRQTVGSHSLQLKQIYKAIENMLAEKEELRKSWEERERIGFKPRK